GEARTRKDQLHFFFAAPNASVLELSTRKRNVLSLCGIRLGRQSRRFEAAPGNHFERPQDRPISDGFAVLPDPWKAAEPKWRPSNSRTELSLSRCYQPDGSRKRSKRRRQIKLGPTDKPRLPCPRRAIAHRQRQPRTSTEDLGMV